MEKIGICVTTFNNEKIIENVLMAIVNQKTEHRFEVFIVDDGSKDQTPVILREFEQKYDFFKIKLAEHRERGLTRQDCINMAFTARCDYILFIDSDMVLADNLIETCMQELQDESVSALVIPEKPVSKHNNFMTQVKVFERTIINDVGSDLDSNSVEAARFWRVSEYLRSGGLDHRQISFEETQPTIRIIERGGRVMRATKTHLEHDEGLVTLKNILQKKNYYFSQMNKTLENEEGGFLKAVKRSYFFRPYLYSLKSLRMYLKNPLKTSGLINMYILLSLLAVNQVIKNKFKLGLIEK